MKIEKLTFLKSDLLKLPQDELTLFLSCGYVINELNSLNKLLLWASKRVPDEIEWKGRVVHSMFLCRISAGKLHEARELITKKYFGTALSRVYDPLLDHEAKEILKNINSYFGKTNMLSTVRNSYSFHYSELWPNGVQNALNQISDSDLSFFLSDINGNSLFHLSDVLASYEMLFKIDPNPQAALDRLFGEVLQVSNWFISFLNYLISAIIQKHWSPDSMQWQEIDMTGLPRLNDLQIHYFIERDAPDSGNPEVW